MYVRCACVWHVCTGGARLCVVFIFVVSNWLLGHMAARTSRERLGWKKVASCIALGESSPALLLQISVATVALVTDACAQWYHLGSMEALLG